MKCPAEVYTPAAKPCRGIGELQYPFHDKTIVVTNCGRLCVYRTIPLQAKSRYTDKRTWELLGVLPAFRLPSWHERDESRGFGTESLTTTWLGRTSFRPRMLPMS